MSRTRRARPSVGTRVHALRWWIAVAVTLGAGFADLARGGIVLAPLLLAAAYLVLVPTALLRR